MKMKSFAMLAISALLAACPYVALAMADDTSQNQSGHPSMMSNDDDSSVSAPAPENSSVSTNSMDQGVPDTATGDDDDY